MEREHAEYLAQARRRIHGPQRREPASPHCRGLSDLSPQCSRSSDRRTSWSHSLADYVPAYPRDWSGNLWTALGFSQARNQSPQSIRGPSKCSLLAGVEAPSAASPGPSADRHTLYARYYVCSVIAASLQARTVVFPFAIRKLVVTSSEAAARFGYGASGSGPVTPNVISKRNDS